MTSSMATFSTMGSETGHPHCMTSTRKVSSKKYIICMCVYVCMYVYIYIYIYIYTHTHTHTHQMTLPRFAVVQKTTVSILLSVIIFTGARGARKRYQEYNYSKFISAIPKTMIRHYSSIMFTCHPFQPSPIPLLRVILFRSILLSMLQNYKKIVLISHRLAAFHSQCQCTRIFRQCHDRTAW